MRQMSVEKDEGTLKVAFISYLEHLTVPYSAQVQDLVFNDGTRREPCRVRQHCVTIDAELWIWTLPHCLVSVLNCSLVSLIHTTDTNAMPREKLRPCCQLLKLSFAKGDLLKSDHVRVKTMDCLFEKLFTFCIPVLCV